MLYNISMTKKKKIITIVSISVSLVLVLTVCLLLVFLLKPQKANTVSVINTGQNIYVKSSVAEGEKTYRFKFVSGDEIREFDSSSHLFDITNLLWNGDLNFGDNYSVSVCYVDSSGILAGDYSESVNFVAQIKLASPEVSIDEQNLFLNWENIQGADFYFINYYDGNQFVKIKSYETSFELSTIKGGDRNIYVTSASEHEYFLESEKSNTLSVQVIHELLEFDSAFLNSENKTITIYANEFIDEILLTVDGEQYKIYDFDIIQNDGEFEITFSISLIYNSSATFKVSPAGDLYNVFNGEPTLVTLT